MYQSNSCIKHLFFSFSSDFFTLSTRFLCRLTRLSLEFFVVFHFVFHFVSDYLLFVLSWMQWMLVTVSKTIISLWKTFSKISLWDMPCIRLSLLYEKHLLACCSPSSAIIISSEAHGMSFFHTRNFKLE